MSHPSKEENESVVGSVDRTWVVAQASVVMAIAAEMSACHTREAMEQVLCDVMQRLEVEAGKLGAHTARAVKANGDLVRECTSVERRALRYR